MNKNKLDESADPVRRLRRLDACAVSDALDKLGIPGAAQGLSQLSSAHRVAGRAITVKLGVGQAATGTPRHLGTTAIALAQPGDIIIVEQLSGIDAGSWGGILTLSAKVRGVAGVIADGSVRDLDEARQYDFPIFARGTTPRTARGRIVELGTQVPIVAGGIAVEPGDFVIADASGVVFIPCARIDDVLDAAEAIAAREAAMAKDVLAGIPVTEVMGATYEDMLHASA